jgi:arylsulfatase A-like enzyme/Flp pilus assembly protein TadD
VTAACLVATVLWWAARTAAPGLDEHRATTTPGPARVDASRADGVLLVTVDTLRADRVGVYGHAAARTPAFDALARRGVRFTRAYAPAPITLPSHASLLSGRNPPAHGARHNGVRMEEGVPTLATVLADQGFETAAFVSAFPLDRRFGLARGFATYDDALPRGRDGRPLDERPGGSTVDAALAWLAEVGERPFLLWVHLFEPHAPYGRPAGERDASAPVPGPVAARYDAEIAEADRQLGRLLDALGSRRARTLVVVAGDHGEAFGEHGEVAHSLFVYDTTLRVPLAIAGPGVPDSGRAVDAAVGLVDVAPTVLALLGFGGLDPDGIDLRPWLTGSTRPDDGRALYAESFAPLLDFGWSPLRSVRQGRWKYIEAPRPELYDIRADPGEQHDLVNAEAATAAQLAEHVTRFGPPVLDVRERIAPETASRLGALGYVTPERPRIGAERPDPKDRRTVAARVAEVASGEVAPDRLVAVLESILRDDPANLQAQLRLGVALADRGRCAAGEPHLRAAIAGGLPTADPFLPLALCLRARDDTEGARRVLVEASRVEPGNPVVQANLGLLAFDQGRLDDAIALLDTALRIDSDLHEARFVLARALARTGRREVARAQVDTLLMRLPADAPQRPEVERLRSALQ